MKAKLHLRPVWIEDEVVALEFTRDEAQELLDLLSSHDDTYARCVRHMIRDALASPPEVQT